MILSWIKSLINSYLLEKELIKKIAIDYNTSYIGRKPCLQS